MPLEAPQLGVPFGRQDGDQPLGTPSNLGVVVVRGGLLQRQERRLPDGLQVLARSLSPGEFDMPELSDESGDPIRLPLLVRVPPQAANPNREGQAKGHSGEGERSHLSLDESGLATCSPRSVQGLGR
jgi:hypothetical protein